MHEIKYTSTLRNFWDLDFEKPKELKLSMCLIYRSNLIMATYECAKCGMAVNAEGKKIQVSVCPNGHGKIKSPTCCGADMDCKG